MVSKNDNSSGAVVAAGIKGLTKAAILLVSLEADSAAALLRNLDDAIVEEITREIARLDLIENEHRSAVIEEFYNLAMARQYLKQGGIPYAKALLDKALPADQASYIIKLIEHEVFQKPFSFLAKTDSDNLMTFIRDEHPCRCWDDCAIMGPRIWTRRPPTASNTS